MKDSDLKRYLCWIPEDGQTRVDADPVFLYFSSAPWEAAEAYVERRYDGHRHDDVVVHVVEVTPNGPEPECRFKVVTEFEPTFSAFEVE